MVYRDIFEAVASRNVTAVKYFVEVKHAEINARNDDRNTVAHIAAKNVDLPMLEYVLNKNSSLVSIRGEEGLTLTEMAIGINSMTLLKYLIEIRKIDIYEQGDKHNPGTCVHFAAHMCNLEMFKYFIEEKNVDVNLRDVWQQPLAFSAARGPCLNVLEYIVETGKADLSLTDLMGRNIFSQSAMKCDLTVPRFLLDEKKLDIDTNNTFIIQDAIAFQEKFKSNKLDEFMKYFVEEKHMNINSGITETPLHRAAKSGMLDVVKYLVRHGADVRRKDLFDHTPLEVSSDKEVIKYLKEQEGNRSRRSVAKYTPRIIPRLTQADTGIHGSPLWIGHSTNADKLERFAVVGSHCIHTLLHLVNGYVNRKSQRHVWLSPQDIMNNRMDSTAISAIHDY